MRLLTSSAVLLAICATGADAAEATFLGKSIYTANRADCTKLKALSRGTPRSLNTVPDTLSAKGYAGWEGGCKIAKVTPSGRRLFGFKSWKMDLVCSEGAIENAKSRETWTLNKDGSVTTQGKGGTRRYAVCSRN